MSTNSNLINCLQEEAVYGLDRNSFLSLSKTMSLFVILRNFDIISL